MGLEKDVLKALKKMIARRPAGWTWTRTNPVLSKKEFLERLKKDKQFRRQVTKLVVDTSVAIL